MVSVMHFYILNIIEYLYKKIVLLKWSFEYKYKLNSMKVIAVLNLVTYFPNTKKIQTLHKSARLVTIFRLQGKDTFIVYKMFFS